MSNISQQSIQNGSPGVPSRPCPTSSSDRAYPSCRRCSSISTCRRVEELAGFGSVIPLAGRSGHQHRDAYPHQYREHYRDDELHFHAPVRARPTWCRSLPHFIDLCEPAQHASHQCAISPCLGQVSELNAITVMTSCASILVTSDATRGHATVWKMMSCRSSRPVMSHSARCLPDSISSTSSRPVVANQLPEPENLLGIPLAICLPQ